MLTEDSFFSQPHAGCSHLVSGCTGCEMCLVTCWRLIWGLQWGNVGAEGMAIQRLQFE